MDSTSEMNSVYILSCTARINSTQKQLAEARLRKIVFYIPE